MKRFIGTKLINAKPMNRQEYNDFRGWKLPDDECGADEGFLVEYVDGGSSNTDSYAGYVSWSPKDVFENSYRETAGMSFGSAIEAMKIGQKVCRSGWNGKGMFLFLVPGSNFKVNRAPLMGIYPEGTDITYQPHIDMKTAHGTIVPWLASQSDMLEDDWMIII
jgi:hypothetical protein